VLLGRRTLYLVVGVSSVIGLGAGGTAYALTTDAASASSVNTPPAPPAGFMPNGDISPDTCLPIYSATAADHIQRDAKGNVTCNPFGPPPAGAFGNGG